MGKFGWGADDKNSLKFSCISDFYYSCPSIIFSKSFKNKRDKWQLARYNQKPFLEPSPTFSLAFCAYPCPKETCTKEILRSVAFYYNIDRGSVPGDKMNIIGVVFVELSNNSSNLNPGGVINFSPNLS